MAKAVCPRLTCVRDSSIQQDGAAHLTLAWLSGLRIELMAYICASEVLSLSRYPAFHFPCVTGRTDYFFSGLPNFKDLSFAGLPESRAS